MKLNNFYISPPQMAMKSPDDEALVRRPAILVLTYLKDDSSSYTRMSMKIGVGSLDNLPDLTALQKELIQKACDYYDSLPVDTSFSKFISYQSAESLLWDAPGKSRKEPDPRIGCIRVVYKNKSYPDIYITPCYKCPKTGNWLDTDIDNVDLSAEVKSFAQLVFNHERKGVKVYKRLFQIQQEKLELKSNESKSRH